MQVNPGTRPEEEVIEEACDKLLANVNMETYRFEIMDVEEA